MLREFPEIRTQKLIKCHICSSLDTHRNYHIFIHQPVNQKHKTKSKSKTNESPHYSILILDMFKYE